MMSEPIRRVLLTDAGAKSTLAAVRSLAGRGIEVHVASHTRMAIAAWSRFCTRWHRLPASEHDGRAFARALNDLQCIERFDAVIPVSDHDIAALLEHLTEAERGQLNVALPDRRSFETARDKSLTMKCAIAAGVACPETWFPEDEPLEAIQARAKYPLLVKPNISAGARGITLVERPEDLKSTYEAVVARWGASHLQEWIPPGGAQFKADIAIGPGGEQLGLFACRKLRYYPVTGGSSTLIVSEHHPQIEEDVRALACALDWYGFADFDFIEDPRDGVAKLMECNPRFPESMAVAIFAGIDFPWIICQLAARKAAQPVGAFAEGRFARFLVGDVMWFLQSPDRWRAKPGFFRFFGKDMVFYVEKMNDLGPFLCQVCEAIATLLSPKKMAYRFSRGLQRNN